MAKGTMRLLEYMFIFEKEANLWNNIFDFEEDLAAFFSANGMEAEIVSASEGNMGRRVMMIGKIEEDGVQTLKNTKGVNIQRQMTEGKPQKSEHITRTLVTKVTGGGKKK